MQFGPLGVWGFLDSMPVEEVAEFAGRIEALGYSMLWIPEAVGRDPFALLGFLAARTQRLGLATGIANIYARDPMTMRAVQETLAEIADGRFVLGLGVSHERLVTGLRGHEYRKPVTAMREYLTAMRAAMYRAVAPRTPAPIVLAALRPAMLRVAREEAQGAHPYLTPPEHTARARAILGPDRWLAPEQMVMLETDAGKARAAARGFLKVYISLPNYQRNLKWLGFDDGDFADGGSDRLVDAVVAWGDERAIAARIKAHHDAGADHVCIQALRPDGEQGVDMRAIEAVAPGKS
ncbi:MAG: TIGR03620 family F420-dependent LLM class oxidoreductase [Candidatus Binatia bacterium]